MTPVAPSSGLRAAALLGACALVACPGPPGEGQDSRPFEGFPDSDSDVIGPAEVGPLEVSETFGSGEVDGGCTGDEACRGSDPCVVGRCVDGACETEPRQCPADSDPCTDAICRPGVGCDQVPNLRPCDDGDGCTVDDRCSGGSCVGRALDCDDFEACTVDTCEAGRGCVHTQSVGPCDDGDACTTDDACSDHGCVGVPRICPAPPGSHGCSIATCDPRDGCGLRQGTGPCDDADLCTSDEQCVDGACRGTLVVCDDGDPCTDDACDPASGCTSTPNQAPCDDGDGCTGPDRCHAGVCTAGPATACCAGASDCDDLDPCTVDGCERGNCTHAPACDDHNPCTFDTCAGGTCGAEPSPPVPRAVDGGLVLEGFESALDGRWSLTSDNPLVGWQRDDRWAAAGAWSLYVGKVPDYSYDFGATRAVATWRGPLPTDAGRLVVTVRSAVAEASCSYDALVVMIDDEALVPAVCGPNGDGAERGWDVSVFAGREVRLSFVFDTVDDQDNDGEGLWVDALRVERTDVARCCETASDCDADPVDACPEPVCGDHRCGLDDSACH